MERMQYDEYSTRDLGGDDARVILVSRMCERVERLVSQARTLRASLDNEETWRLKTEHLILERFETDVNCHICAHRRWSSDFEAVPNCPVAAATLKRVRDTRQLCQCSEIVRAKLLAEAPSQQFFVTKGSCTFVDRSMVEIQKNMLAHHRPDRVLGLGRSCDLQDLLVANPDMPATVIGGDMNMYFPFLILEAKSEKNSVGFESIERQTVFPIRAMLALQKSLEAAENRAQFDPLVWFLANRGDEWRVYACVPDRGQTRIIDLWHGSILRHDSALQLLLVVDVLCDWAREIFVQAVASILRENAGLDSPALLSQPTGSLEAAPHMPCEQIESGFDPSASGIKDEPGDSSMEEDLSLEMEVPSSTDSSTFSSPKQPTQAAPDKRNAWEIILDKLPDHIALRRYSDVRLQFRYLSLPENDHDLSTLVEALGGKNLVSRTAANLVELFNLKSPLVIQPGFLDKIRRAWGEPGHQVDQNHGQPAVYACLHWRAILDDNDWTLTKEIACITASGIVIEALKEMSHVRSRTVSHGGQCTDIARFLIRPLRYLPLPELVYAASKCQFMYLRVTNRKASAEGWTQDISKSFTTAAFWHCRDSQPSAFLGCLQNVTSTAPATSHFIVPDDDIYIPSIIQVPEQDSNQPFALLREPIDRRNSKQPYCIFAFQNASIPIISQHFSFLLHRKSEPFFGQSRRMTHLDVGPLFGIYGELE